MLEVTKDNFESDVAQSDVPVIIDFWADWCGPCKILAPTFEKVSAEYEGKVLFAKVNVDAETDLAQQFEVRSIPTMVVFKGGKEVDRFMGALSADDMKAKLDQALEK